jgi:hypothetical protein
MKVPRSKVSGFPPAKRSLDPARIEAPTTLAAPLGFGPEVERPVPVSNRRCLDTATVELAAREQRSGQVEGNGKRLPRDLFSNRNSRIASLARLPRSLVLYQTGKAFTLGGMDGNVTIL